MLPRERSLRRIEKCEQQGILALGQRDRGPIGVNEPSATSFELPATEPVPASLRIEASCDPPHFLPPQDGTNAGKQFSKAEWLYDIVVRTEFETDDERISLKRSSPSS
jgi:hypothetical protein